jgi:hypothetical protein
MKNVHKIDERERVHENFETWLSYYSFRSTSCHSNMISRRNRGKERKSGIPYMHLDDYLDNRIYVIN